MTRRTFATLAATQVLRPADARIRAAVVGTGHGHAISKIRALGSMPEYELVGVCRPDASEPATTVRSLTLEEIRADASIEMVAIETADVDRNLDYAELFVEAGRSFRQTSRRGHGSVSQAVIPSRGATANCANGLSVALSIRDAGGG